MEFWQSNMLMGIASKVGSSVALDDFITKYQKRGFARVRMDLNSSEPFNPGISI